ncbi:hypothetical protein [Lysobacter sp. Root494]|uniref:hypothetical protein n=1 Tax=Lysobacter sp. Root494 TaxID=1736549 RepID=UPI0006F31E12|nr:hypothetical protein [Lysobacter sp. Root494]KQY55140.1 hypothetical protein ASD14_03015 [Lysobacter sp. Root494]
MTTTFPASRHSPWYWIVLGGITLGTLDLLFACTFWGVLRDVAPERILQSIAAGVQGKAAFEGGIASAALGAACHYLIATMMVLAYHLASTRWAALAERVVLYGLPYGLLLYAAMTYVVVPLSNAPQPTKVYPSWTVASIIMHALFGVICAWFARRARQYG